MKKRHDISLTTARQILTKQNNGTNYIP